MTWFHLAAIVTVAQFLGAVLCVTLIVAAAVALGYGGLRKTKPGGTSKSYLESVAGAYPYIFILTLVGALTGQLTGGSRTGVVGEVLPALLGLLGPFLAYFLGTKRDAGGKVSVNALAFLLGFFIMANLAAVWRQDTENRAFCQTLFSDTSVDSPFKETMRRKYWADHCYAVMRGLPSADTTTGQSSSATQDAVK